MRAALVFPPHLSPTYVPLGVAMLAAVTRTAEGAPALHCLDLNVALWERVAAADAEARGYVEFVRGQAGDFYSEVEYRAHQPTLARLEQAVARETAAVRHALAESARAPAAGEQLDWMVAAIRERDPELIGLSIFCFDQLPWALALAGRLGEGAAPRVVLGGPAVSALHVDDLLAACPGLFGVVDGAGEAAWLALLRRAPPESVPGLHHRGASARPAPWPATADVPDFGGLPLSRYFSPAPVLPLLHSRGCKWRRCRFCAHGLSYGRYQVEDADGARVVEALAERHGARHFYFADLYVDAPEHEALGRNLTARGLHVAYHALGRPTADYSAGRLRAMAASGCRWVSWGVESGSQRLLDIAGKGTRVETVGRVLRDAHAAGISNLAFMMFGLPTSTDVDLAATLDFLEAHYEVLEAMTATPFALFENTPFGRHPDRFGLIAGANQVEIRVVGESVRSRRVDFRERAVDGGERPPRGGMEASAWRRHRRWLGDPPLLETVPCEHYLLRVAPPPGRGSGGWTVGPETGVGPVIPAG